MIRTLDLWVLMEKLFDGGGYFCKTFLHGRVDWQTPAITPLFGGTCDEKYATSLNHLERSSIPLFSKMPGLKISKEVPTNQCCSQRCMLHVTLCGPESAPSTCEALPANVQSHSQPQFSHRQSAWSLKRFRTKRIPGYSTPLKFIEI